VEALEEVVEGDSVVDFVVIEVEVEIEEAEDMAIVDLVLATVDVKEIGGFILMWLFFVN
jgi:hypothetical protein